MATAHYPGIARYLLGTVVLSTGIAVAITAFGSRHHDFGENLVYSLCIGLLTYATIDLTRRMLWPQGMPSIAPMFVLVLIAAPIAWFGGTFIASLLMGMPWGPTSLGLTAVLGFLVLTAGAGFAASYYFWTRERLMATERSAAEARLKLLQAQIEPHFLFNTLANLQALIGVDPARAQEMLRHLDGYLRATLASTRNDRDTLAVEFALLKSYLEILAIRMGPRLAYELDLPQELAAARLPPMLMQPLVENAIRHGLEPKIDGGKVTVSARGEGKSLVLVVQDTGQGLGRSASGGTGVGLAHVKERLAAVYGETASMTVGENAGNGPSDGACITLRLPLEK